MSPIQAYGLYWQRYTDFRGRSSRSEYWWATLFNLIIGIILFELSIHIHTFSAIYLLWILVSIIPGLALGVRRLHDTDKSGWFILIGIVPIIGGILLLVFFCTRSSGANRYDSRSFSTGY